MHITNSTLPKIQVKNYKQPSFLILSKLHLFLLFSKPSFLYNFSLNALNPYFITLCNLQRNAKSLNNNNTYTYLF